MIPFRTAVLQSSAALSFFTLIHKENKLFMHEIDDYVKVGTKYYLKRDDSLISWDRQGIIDKFGKDRINDVSQYIKFCLNPSNTNYAQIQDDSYNRYAKPHYSAYSGKFDNISTFISHIFGDQSELGYDYFQLLWTKPKQLLPVLVLVSYDKHTGKTTFLDFIREVFRNNSTTLSQIEWNEKYNLSYATKLVATMEEAKFKNGAMIDRLKALATDKKIRIREMRMDSYEVDYYCKFILSSNHEKDFISIDGDEIRFWIRKIGQVKFIDGFFDKLKSEIPAFLYFLENRTMSTKPESRMWFKPSLIKTKELDTVKINSIDENSKSIISYLYDRLGTDFEYKSKTKGDEIRTKTEYISNDTKIKRSLIPKLIREVFGSNLNPSPVRMVEGKPVQKCWCIPVLDIENKYNEIFG